MQKLILILGAALMVSACGPSQEEREKVAAVTCSIMGETRNMDAAVRVEKMNEAREKIGGEPFLRGDDAIKEAFDWGLCQQLVLNKIYDESLQSLKDAKQERERIAAEKRAEEQRIAAEKRAEEQRIAAEKQAEEQKIADTKPSVKKKFWANGNLRSRINYRSKNDGGLEHGLYELYYKDGQLEWKGNYKDGKEDGLWEWYHENAKFLPNQGLKSKGNWKDGKPQGLHETYGITGSLKYRNCYKNGGKTVMSYCEK